MPEDVPTLGSLVLYKKGPALVHEVADKLEIELYGGKRLRVRPKDVTLLHPGPLRSLNELNATDAAGLQADVEAACELLAGETATLGELAELAYGDFTPASAWSAWELLAQDLYFYGEPGAIRARDPEQVAEEQRRREAKAAEEAAWQGFVERAAQGRVGAGDREFLLEVEEQARGRKLVSKVLQALGREQTRENAHALLLKLGAWDGSINPHPERLGVPLAVPEVGLDELLDEPRADLTHLAAFAIDDEGNQDPDDALSLEPGRLWVHVADAAAVAAPGTPADLEARSRGATLYLPERIVPMLPPAAVQRLGLGLESVSPALSFGLDLGADGEVTGLELVLSRVRVQRLSYQQVEGRLDQEPFRSLLRVADQNRARRKEQGAVFIELPEVDVKIDQDRVVLRPVPSLASRGMVSEAMLMAGEATARYAQANGIPFPFTTQDSDLPAGTDKPDPGPVDMYALRRGMRPRRYRSTAAPHRGLGLEHYAQVTSPLRRYLDLLAHQQLRAHLRGKPLLDPNQVVELIGATDAVSPGIRKAERLSKLHWTLVYLIAHPGWRGPGILVESTERRGTFLIPELGLDVSIPVKQGAIPLGEHVPLRLTGIDLPTLDARFRLEK